MHMLPVETLAASFLKFEWRRYTPFDATASPDRPVI
jgi:hypothetical protein